MFLLKRIENIIRRTILILQKEKKIPSFSIPHFEVNILLDNSYGDYTSNILFILAQKTGLSFSRLLEFVEPVLSQEISKTGFLSKFEIKNNFVNFFVSKEYLTRALFQVMKEKDRFGSSKEGRGKTMVIDYSSPNIAKPFGIGHLRSTIIGQAIYNIYGFSGWRTIGDNHIGDWGTQFGKLIYQIKKFLKGKTKKEKDSFLKKLTIEKLEKLYVDFHKEAARDKELEDKARESFRLLEKGEPEARAIWQYSRETSLREFDKIYNILGVKFDYTLGESFYIKMVPSIIEEVVQKGLAHKSQGALVIEYPGDVLPSLVLVKSDGTSTYLARDLATIKYRIKKWHPQIVVYEVGTEQSLYFKQLFQLVNLLGWGKKTLFVHIGHGLFRTKEGKLSTRQGRSIYLSTVLEEAVKRASQIVNQSKNSKISEKEKNKIAMIVGIGAVKYNDLAQSYRKDVIFDWSKVLNLKGNSGPYVQYTYARAKSILERAEFDYKNIHLDSNLLDLNKAEVRVARLISKFPEVVLESARTFSPHLICNFVFSLSQAYNNFYNSYPVIKEENPELKKFRIILTASTSQVLKNGLLLLGIDSPERM